MFDKTLELLNKILSKNLNDWLLPFLIVLFYAVTNYNDELFKDPKSLLKLALILLSSYLLIKLIKQFITKVRDFIYDYVRTERDNSELEYKIIENIKSFNDQIPEYELEYLYKLIENGNNPIKTPYTSANLKINNQGWIYLTENGMFKTIILKKPVYEKLKSILENDGTISHFPRPDYMK